MRNFHILFPSKDSKIEEKFISIEECNTFWKEIEMSIVRIDCEKETQLFYNEQNKNEFIEELESLGELLQIGNFEKDEVLNLLFQDNDVKSGNYSQNVIYKKWITENEQTIDCEEFEKDLVENKIKKVDEDFYILSFNENTFSKRIKILRDAKNACPQIFCFNVYYGFLEIDTLFSEINSNRKLNKEDFRHCEDHSDFRRDKSPLIGGTQGFKNAERFLNSAIGDSRAGKNILINIDTNNQDFYIRYEDENFNNQYHAFHLVKNQDNDYLVDSEGINISKSVNKGIPRAFHLLQYRLDKQ